MPLPSLADPHPVSASAIQQFRRDGHIHIPGVLSPDEAAAYRAVIISAADRFNTEKRKIEERDTYGKAFLQIMNLWEVDESVKRFTLAKRFGRMAADLLGVKNVRIYHDQALFKESGGGPTPWHQDQYYWPVDTDNTITMWMPLIDVSEEMGMLTFASKSHVDGLVKNVAISDDSEALLEKYVKGKKFPVNRPQFMKAGDASWHYGLTLHKAPGNESKTLREVMTIIYFADGARITKPINDNQEADRLRWFQGLPAGAPAASLINPAIL